jgi:hypothetical protein
LTYFPRHHARSSWASVVGCVLAACADPPLAPPPTSDAAPECPARILIDDFEGATDDDCSNRANGCIGEPSCREFNRSIVSGECTNAFCSDASLCETRPLDGPTNHVLRLEGLNAIVSNAPTTFGGYSIPLALSPAVLSLPSELDCLTFQIRAEHLPAGSDLEISLKQSATTAEDPSHPPETDPKVRVSNLVQTGPDYWCKAAIHTERFRRSASTRVDFRALEGLNLLLTTYQGDQQQSVGPVDLALEIDDLAFESCSGAGPAEHLCPEAT